MGRYVLNKIVKKIIVLSNYLHQCSFANKALNTLSKNKKIIFYTLG